MRESAEVLDRFQEMRDRCLRERKEKYLSRLPVNCSYNTCLRVRGKGQFRFCGNPLVLARCGSQKMFMCHEPDTAHRCRLFVCRNTEQLVEQTFEEIMRSPSRCGNDYPKLAMLIWFLQDFEIQGRAVRLFQAGRRLVVSFVRLVCFKWW